MSMIDVVVNFVPTGMIPTKEMTPHVPVSINEIVDDVHQAYELGITMVHLHARDPETGEPTYHEDVYGRIIEGIRSFSQDLIVGVSLSGRTFSRFEERSAPLRLESDLKPDMGSLTLSSVNFNRQVSVSSPEMIVRLAAEMKKRNIAPELEAFDIGMINYAKYLEKKGLLEAPHYFNLILGNIACAQADLLHASVMINELPKNSYWSLAGIGDSQLKMNSVAIAAGYGVRVGLEDTIWFDTARSRLARNADLIQRIHRLAGANERGIMKPEELRRRLDLDNGFGRYGKKNRVQ